MSSQSLNMQSLMAAMYNWLSLDNVVATPPFSALIAILLLAGCIGVGRVVLDLFSLNTYKWQRLQAAVVGAMVWEIILYPLALAGLSSQSVMFTFAVICASIGLMVVFREIRSAYKSYKDNPAIVGQWMRRLTVWKVALLLLIAGVGLMALGPVTDADSLDYHIGVPLALLRVGGMPVEPEWMPSRLAGSGEILNALGLAVGAEQFGALLQVAALFGIVALILFAESDTQPEDTSLAKSRRMLASIAALSAPTCVSLISAKPQLLPIAMTTFAFALLIYPSRRNLSSRETIVGYAIICMLVMSASQNKLTYMLGGGIVGLLALAYLFRRKLLLPGLGVGIFAAIVIVVPPVVWKHLQFHAGFVDALTKPAPGWWPGSDTFEKYLRGVTESDIQFPLSLIVPSGIGTLSTIIGIGIILFIGIRPGKDRWLWVGTAAAGFVAIIAAMFGPSSSRSYLEPYFWLLIIFALQAPRVSSINIRWFQLPIAGQAFLTIFMTWYGVVTLLPGAISSHARSRIMERSANGYQVMKWADRVLPSDAVFLTSHRSMSLAPREMVSLYWTTMVDPASPDAVPYLNRLKQRKVTHILTIGDQPDFGKLSGCVGEYVAGPGYGRLATRNPLNLGAPYKAWVFEFNSTLLPECVWKRNK